MLEEVKKRIHVLADCLQAVLGYIELEEYTKAQDSALRCAEEIKSITILLSQTKG